MEPLSNLLQQLSRSGKWNDLPDRTQEVLAHPLIGKLCAKHPELTDQTLRLNINSLYQYIKEHAQCSACPGLDRCPNTLEGHYTMIAVEQDGEGARLYDRKVSCKKFIARQQEEAIKKRIKSFYVDERALTQGYSFEDILDADEERQEAVARLMLYIDSVRDNGLSSRGLYLDGGFGTGKTFLISYMLRELAKIGLNGVIVYMPDFVEDLKAMFGEAGKMKETIELLKETDLLVFDDIGAENLNPWVRDHVVGTILNYRMNRRPTFFTSNYDLDGLERHLRFTYKEDDDALKGLRLMDRIRPFVDVIHVGGSNKRGALNP